MQQTRRDETRRTDAPSPLTKLPPLLQCRPGEQPIKKMLAFFDFFDFFDKGYLPRTEITKVLNVASDSSEERTAMEELEREYVRERSERKQELAAAARQRPAPATARAKWTRRAGERAN